MRQEKINTGINILMNGPSLSKDFQLIDNALPSLCVNQLSTTKFFVKIKPNFYLLLDYFYWSSNVRDEYLKLRQEAFDALNKYTTWHMTLYIPSFANINYIQSMINSPYIKVRSFTLNPLPFGTFIFGKNPYTRSILFYLWSKSVLSPPPSNVLIGSIYLATMLMPSKIYLYGADYSIFKNIEVDQNTNQLIYKSAHFYGSSSKQIFLNKYKDSFNRPSMHHELTKWGKVFGVLSLVSQYCSFRGIHVINKSSYSLIDVFARSE